MYKIPVTELKGKEPTQVKATLYSQAFMPSWFYQRFSLANEAKANGYNTPATDRLFYLAANLDLTKTPMKNWKIEIDSSGLKAVKTKIKK